MTYEHLRNMTDDQLCTWMCEHPNPNRAEREALSRLVAELQPGVRA